MSRKSANGRGISLLSRVNGRPVVHTLATPSAAHSHREQSAARSKLLQNYPDHRLTSRQFQALRFIVASVRTRGTPPTTRELASHLRVCNGNYVLQFLTALERKGYIERDAGVNRGMRVLRDHAVVRLPGMPR